MWEGYEEAVRSGAKRQTIRIDDPFRPGPALVVFEKESGDVVSVPATVEAVEGTTRAALSENDAHRDGFSDLSQLDAALDRHYPGVGPDGPVDVVSFTLTDDPGRDHR